MDFVLLICLTIFFFMLWCFVCNRQTYNNRSKIIKALFQKDDWRLLSDLFDDTTYEEELFARAFFRDWHKLYHPILRSKLPEIFEKETL